jgi:hypothetical protein
MSKLIYLCLLLFIAYGANAKDLVTVSGKTYKNYEIEGVSRKGIEIFHSKGIAAIKPTDWPKNQRDEIKQYLSTYKDLCKKASYRALDKYRQKLTLKIIQVEKKGLITYDNLLSKVDSRSNPDVDTILAFCTKEEKVVFKKLLVKYKSPNYGADHTKRLATGSFLSYLKKKRDYPVIYLTGLNTASYVDGGEWTGYAYRIGRHQYLSTGGGMKTIAKYTVDKDEALRFRNGDAKKQRIGDVKPQRKSREG